MERHRKTVNLEHLKLDVRSVTLEELDGEAEIAALERANGSPREGQEQLVAEAIVAVDGQEVVRPYVEWKRWKSRTRDFVRGAFNRLNSASPKEMEAFLQAEFGADEPGARSSSASGSGSPGT